MTYWPAIAAIYEALLALTGSPVVAINHAVALAEAGAPTEGLAELVALAADKRLQTYQPYWAARADLMARTGDPHGAGDAYDMAIGLQADPAARRYLQRKRAALGAAPH